MLKPTVVFMGSPKKSLHSGLAVSAFILVISSLIAIKINYFTDLTYKASSRSAIDGSVFENRLQTGGWLMRPLKKPTHPPELIQALAELTEQNKWNIEFFHPHLIHEKIISQEPPFKIQYSIKSKFFRKQDFKITELADQTLRVEYSYGGIKRIRTIKEGQQLNEIELNLTIRKNESLLPFQHKDYINKPVGVRIFSPQAYAEHLLDNHVSVESKGQASTVITVNYPDAVKAKNISDALATRLATSAFNKTYAETEKEILITAEKIKSEFRSPSGPIIMHADEPVRQAQLASLISRQHELSLRLFALDNLHDYLRQNRTDGSAVPEFGLLADPVFAEYITGLNKLLYQIQQTHNPEQKQKLFEEAEFLKNTLAEGMRNTRKSVALQIDETKKMIADLTGSAMPVIPAPKQDEILIEKDLALKRYQLLLEKLASAPAMPEVTPAPLPITPENPDRAAVWMIALITGLLLSVMIIRLRKPHASDPVSPAALPDSYNDILFTTLQTGKKSKVEKQFEKWACDTRIMLEQKNGKIVALSCDSESDSLKTGLSLAMACSGSAFKTLLIDCGSDYQAFLKNTGIGELPPLTDLLISNTGLHMAVGETEIPNLSVAHLGFNRMEFHPQFLTGKLGELISSVNLHHDIIILAVPPTNDPITLSLMRMADIGFVSGKENPNISEPVRRWRSIFGLNHIYAVRSELPDSFVIKPKKKVAVKMLKRKNEDEKEMTWFRKVALWFY